MKLKTFKFLKMFNLYILLILLFFFIFLWFKPFSIHDLGSLSVGSGIFLFRIYVLLMSWHTSRILFYCYGFIASHGIYGHGLYPGFIESLDFISLDSTKRFILAIGFMALDVFLGLCFQKSLTCVKKIVCEVPTTVLPFCDLKANFLTWGYLVKYKNLFVKQRTFKCCFNLNIKCF